MIQPNLPIPLAFYYLAHFLLLLFLSSSRHAPWLPSPPLSLFYPWACSAISASLHLALFPPAIFVSLALSATVSVFISVLLHILIFFIVPYLSDTGRGKGRSLGNGERRALMPHVVIVVDTMGENLAHVPLSLTMTIQTWENSLIFCSFHFHLKLLLFFFLAFVQQTWVTTQCGLVGTSLYIHVNVTKC